MEQSNLEHFLTAMTDAILADEPDVDHIVTHYAISRAEVEGFIRLIRRLHLTLIDVRPSRRFTYRLRQDLLGEPEWNVINRVRFLPPRVQIAAGVALVAGFMLISRRRLLVELPDGSSVEEVPAM